MSVSSDGTTTSAGPTTSDDTETTGPVAECDDTRVAAGELCFGEAELYEVGDSPHDLAIADIDNDGTLDILTVSYESSLLSIIEGDGVGGYTAPTTRPSGLNPFRIRIADFDNDGDNDIVVIGDDIVTFRNVSGILSDSTSAGPMFGSQFGINSMEVLHGNGDEVPDLVYTQAYDYTFAEGEIPGNGWLFNNGESIIPAGEGASGIWVTEFAWDDDDVADVIGLNQYVEAALITTGNGDGTFSQLRTHPVCVDGSGGRHVITADLDADGSQDIIATCINGDFSVSLGQRDMSWQDETLYSLDGAHRPYAYDLDSDGDQDLLIPSTTLDRIALYLNDGTGSFSLSEVEFSTGAPTYTVEVADLNDDGAPDVVTAVHNRQGHVMIWLSSP